MNGSFVNFMVAYLILGVLIGLCSIPVKTPVRKDTMIYFSLGMFFLAGMMLVIGVLVS